MHSSVSQLESCLVERQTSLHLHLVVHCLVLVAMMGTVAQL